MSAAKPTYTPHFNNIPSFLRERKQWIIWNYVWKSKKKKWDKPPHSPHNGYACDLTDPDHWVTFDQAIESMRRFNADGIGFSSRQMTTLLAAISTTASPRAAPHHSHNRFLI